MTKRIIFLPLIALSLIGCDNHVATDDLKIICPTGAPALAFYDLGNNNNFDTNSVPTSVLAQLQKNEYDMVVFDSINGLKSIKSKSANYKLAKVITAGNFYLVSIGKEKDSSGNYPMPTTGDKVVSFGQGLIPDVVYDKLCTDFWHIDPTASYVTSVQDALAVLISGKYSGGNVDYVFIAEPALTTAMNKTDAATYGKVGIVKNIRAEWEAYSGQKGLAQAAIFVNNNSIANKHDKLVQFLNETDIRLRTAQTEVNVAVEKLNAFGTLEEQANRFGFNSNTVSLVQANGKNGFGLVCPFCESIDVNAFLTKLGQPTFEETYFANL